MKTILVDAAGTFVLKEIGIYQPLYQLLEKYPNRKIILTNANDEQLIQFGLVNLPYELFSLKHSPDKVDPEYFRKMLECFGLKAEETICFEHDMKAVESAKSVGIESYWYDGEKKDIKELEKFLNISLA